MDRVRAQITALLAQAQGLPDVVKIAVVIAVLVVSSTWIFLPRPTVAVAAPAAANRVSSRTKASVAASAAASAAKASPATSPAAPAAKKTRGRSATPAEETEARGRSKSRK